MDFRTRITPERTGRNRNTQAENARQKTTESLPVACVLEVEAEIPFGSKVADGK